MNWENHQYGEGVECIFIPRETYEGHETMPGIKEHIGEKVKLKALWLMDETDPYPGEWALGLSDGHSMVFGRTWIASGDITPVEDLK